MYRNAYQRGMLTVFYSVGSKPLNMWETHIQDGYVTRLLDPDIKSMVLEIGGNNVSTTYITCPKGNQILGITLPFLVMIVKNQKKYFSFEVTILDESGFRRRFRVSNFQSSTQILPFCTVMPIGLSDGWNQIQFNLAEFTRRAYKKQYVEVQKLKVNANIRLRRIYFAERLLPEEELPAEYKLFFPLSSNALKGKKRMQASALDKENVKPVSPHLLEQPDTNVEVVKSSKTSIQSTKKQQLQESKKDSNTEVSRIEEAQETDVSKSTGEPKSIKEPTDIKDQNEEQKAVADDATDTDVTQTKTTETTTAEIETVGIETDAAQTTAAETAAAETTTAETTTAETTTAETTAPETAAPETTAPETADPETAAAPTETTQ